MRRFFSHPRGRARVTALARHSNGQAFLLVALTSVLWLLIAALLVFYIFEITRASTRGYTLKTVSERVDDLKRQEKRLEIEVASRESLTSLRARASSIGMMPVGEISYLKWESGAVARR